MVLIVSMMIVRLAIVAATLVALMVVAIFTTRMLMVARFTATRDRKMSRFLFLQLLFVLGNLLKNASHLILVGWLTLLKESNHLDRVGRYHLVQVGKLVLVRLRLHKEDLLTLLLCRDYFHRPTEVANLKVAEKLHSMLHELVHQHECGLLCHTKPENQLVAYIWETSDSLKVVPDALVKICLCMISIIWASLCDEAGPLGQAHVLKALTNETKQQWTIIFLHIQ
jgi:hypothetical protein